MPRGNFGLMLLESCVKLVARAPGDSVAHWANADTTCICPIGHGPAATVVVLMPLHGDAPFLADAVASVFSQTFEEWRLALVLDRPAEAVTHAVERLSESCNRVSVFYSGRPGISAALNQGIASTKSQYIARLDADDLMSPDRLAEQVAEMNDNPSLLVLGSQVKRIDTYGNRIGRSFLPRSFSEIRAIITKKNPIAHPSVIIRRSAIELIRGYNEAFDGVEDYLLWLTVCEMGEIRNSDQLLTSYRTHPSQTTATSAQQLRKLACFARLKYLEASHDFPGQKLLDFVLQSDPALVDLLINKAEESLPRKHRNELFFARSLSLSKELYGLRRALAVVSILFRWPAKTGLVFVSTCWARLRWAALPLTKIHRASAS